MVIYPKASFLLTVANERPIASVQSEASGESKAGAAETHQTSKAFSGRLLKSGRVELTRQPLPAGSAVALSDQQFERLMERLPGSKTSSGATLLDYVTVGGVTTASGALLVQSDKLAAMPVGEISSLLQQTPHFKLDDSTAAMAAETLKSAVNTDIGRVVVVAVSAGMLTVGVVMFFKPKSTWGELAIWFVGAVIVVAIALWIGLKTGNLHPSTSP